jgi:hypothetical protein
MKPFIPREWVKMRKQPFPTATLDHVDQFGTAVFTDGKCVYAPHSPGEVCWVREAWALNHDDLPAGKWRSPVTMPQWAARRHVRILSCVPEQRGEWGWRIEWEESNAL